MPAGQVALASPRTNSGAAFALTITPTRLVVGPGQVRKTQHIDVLNGGPLPLSVTVEKLNFLALPDGSLNFRPQAPWAASRWVKVEPRAFVLAPGATRRVTAAISVPAVPEPGDHQVALVFLVPSNAKRGNLKINRGIAIPTYITVPGPIDSSAALKDLHAPWFATGGPVAISALVRNTGTVHRDFRGSKELSVTGAGHAAAFADFTVPRGATRQIATHWKPPLMCACHLTVSFVNADGAVESRTVRVIVLPLPWIAGLGALSIALGLALWWRRRRYRDDVLAAAAAMGPPGLGGTGGEV